MPDQPDTATDISPAEGDPLVKALEAARTANPDPDAGEIAADDVGATATAERMSRPEPAPPE
ncbi:hypothetical protein BH09PSE2_BH09PSE2_16940 [soil metagenome]